MFWNKKDDKKGLPDLPPMKTSFRTGFNVPKMDEEEEKHDLPAFPDAPMQRDFSQANIKNTITTSDLEQQDETPIPTPRPTRVPAPAKQPYLPEPEESADEAEPIVGQAQKIKTFEMDEWTPEGDSHLDEPPTEKSISTPAKPATPALVNIEKKTGDVFVKIDRFNTARRAINGIKDKIEEMDILLKKIRDVKLREEQELGGWEKDLAALKSRLQDINDNIFS